MFNPTRTLSLVAALAALLAIEAAQASEQSAREWLERSRQAAGGGAWDDVRTLSTRFAVKLPGLEGEAESLTDVLGGRFRDEVELGPYQGADGFDGTTRWERDSSGQVRPMDSDGDRESTANERYRRMYAHWYPARWPASLEDLGDQSEAGAEYRRIRITPEGGRPFVLWIDRATGLTARMVEHDGQSENTSRLEDYRELDGRQIPYRTIFRGGNSDYDQITEVIEVAFNVPIEDDALAMPASAGPDFRFANDSGVTEVPFRLINNHTFLEVGVNGQGPFTMILDTGGVNVITPQVADKLGIESVGKLEVGGVGESRAESSLAKVDSISVGEVTVGDQLFIVLDFDELSRVEGLRVDGLIGYEVFKRFLVRLDYETSRLVLSDPARHSYQGPGQPVRFEFDGHTPVVDGAVDELPGKLTFDTGSRSHVSLHAPFVEANGLLERHPEGVDGITGWGVGGPSRGRVLRGSSLRIGDDIVIQEPLMSMSMQESGAMTDRYQIANLGAGILSRFNLVFDYRDQTIWFETHPGTGRHDNHDRSGLWLNDVGETFEVMGVVEGSPAADADVRAGDRVLSIDGEDASTLFLPDVRVRFRTDPAGTPIRLRLERDGAPVDATLILRDLVPPAKRLQASS